MIGNITVFYLVMIPTSLYKILQLGWIVDVNRFKKGHLQSDQFGEDVFFIPRMESARDRFEFEGRMMILEMELERAVRDWEAERMRSRIGIL
jgi:hypothetical protein